MNMISKGPYRRAFHSKAPKITDFGLGLVLPHTNQSYGTPIYPIFGTLYPWDFPEVRPVLCYSTRGARIKSWYGRRMTSLAWLVLRDLVQVHEDQG